MGREDLPNRLRQREMTADCSSETMQVRRQWSHIFEELKQQKKNCQIRILNPMKTAFKNKVIYRCFSDI